MGRQRVIAKSWIESKISNSGLRNNFTKPLPNFSEIMSLIHEVAEHNSFLDGRHRGLKGSFTELNYSSH